MAWGEDGVGGEDEANGGMGWPSAEELAMEAALDQGLWSASHSLASGFTPVAASSLLQSAGGHPSVPYEASATTADDALTSVGRRRPVPLRPGVFSLEDVAAAVQAHGFSAPRKEVVRLLWTSCHLRVADGTLLQPASQVDVAFLLEVLAAKRDKVAGPAALVDGAYA